MLMCGCNIINPYLQQRRTMELGHKPRHRVQQVRWPYAGMSVLQGRWIWEWWVALIIWGVCCSGIIAPTRPNLKTHRVHRGHLTQPFPRVPASLKLLLHWLKHLILIYLLKLFINSRSSHTFAINIRSTKNSNFLTCLIGLLCFRSVCENQSLVRSMQKRIILKCSQTFKDNSVKGFCRFFINSFPLLQDPQLTDFKASSLIHQGLFLVVVRFVSIEQLLMNPIIKAYIIFSSSHTILPPD